MKRIKIFLDDNRQPTFIENKIPNFLLSEWTLIDNYFDFVKFIDQNINEIEMVSFDHDIASYDDNSFEKTGKDAVDYLISKCLDMDIKFPNWYVHTNNVSGRPNIISSILGYLKHVEGRNIDFQYYHNGLLEDQLLS